MSPIVVIVGAPGAGKTTVGTALAAGLGVTFSDTDVEIERSQGRSVYDIFIDDGEEAFRALERAAVADVMASESGVVAFGGGAVLAPESRALLAGVPTAWLRLAPDAAVKRAGLNAARPMLLGSVRSQLIRLLKDRTPLYEEVATMTVDVDDLEVEVVAAAIAEQLGRVLEPSVESSVGTQEDTEPEGNNN